MPDKKQNINISKRKFEVMRDNLCIRGIEYLPGCGSSQQGANLPIAIVSHGFLANYKTTKHYAKKLAGLGYAAYCFDFIGGGVGSKSDGKLTEMSVLTEKKDLLAVIEYAKSLPYTNADNIILMGCSQGGFVSALIAAEMGETVSKLILLYPALCIPDDARKGEMLFFKFDPGNIPDILSFGPTRIGGVYVKDVINLDPYKEISAYKGPVLILHGKKDKIVKLSYSENAKSAYGKNCSLSILPKAGHGFNKNEDKDALYIINQFLNGKSEILAVDVRLKKFKKIKGKPRKIEISFTGNASGNYFNGKIMPGGVDVQTWNGPELISCRAQYTLSGKDYTGEDCEIHIVNSSSDGKNWNPALETKSTALSFLNNQQCEAHFKMRPKGPLIRIFGKA